MLATSFAHDVPETDRCPVEDSLEMSMWCSSETCVIGVAPAGVFIAGGDGSDIWASG